jgi:nucleotide-binding universal stress UspA family protein
MFDNVLIGIDGRQGGRDAVALAREIAAPEATFTLGHVYDTLRGGGAGEPVLAPRAVSRQLLEREREQAGLDAQLVARGERRVGHGLHEIAEDTRANLLVVGSTRHALLGRVLLGDDCRAALDGAACAIAIAPRGYSLVPHHLRRLGVGYDSSPESEHALSAARELAAAHGGEIRALRVISLEDVREERPIPADWPQAIDELIERQTKQLGHIDGVVAQVIYGGPREELVQFGEDLDLLIVGSRAYGPLGRVLRGSVSRYLVGRVSCPLLVLPGKVGVHRGAAAEAA